MTGPTSKPPRRRKKKRRRKVPQNIAEKTDREIMETVLGKRVMKEVDRLLADHNATTDDASI